MKNRNRQPQRALAMEQLESRYALAGDVFIDVVKGNLSIKGDEAANDLFIAKQPDGTFIVFANDVVTPERFHLNGVDLGDAVFQVAVPDFNGSGDLNFNMLGGNDNIQFGGTLKTDPLARNLSVKETTGADQYQFSNGLISGKVTINTGKKDLSTDNNFVNLQNVNILGAVKVTTYAGADVVAVDQSTFAGKVSIKTGKGADQVSLDGNNQFAKSLTINTGNATGAADNVRFLNGLQVTGTTSVTTGDGNDLLELGTATLKTVKVKTGGGNDTINAGGGGASVVDRAIISLGKGDDIVNLGALLLTFNGPKKSKLAAGAGNDTINGTDNIGNPELVAVSGVENSNP